MSKLKDLPKQYPNLDISIIDFAKLIDRTKSYKYTPVICKILNSKWDFDSSTAPNHKESRKKDIETRLTLKGINHQDLSINEKLALSFLCDMFDDHTFELINDLIVLGERNLLPTKDILTYKDLEQIKNDISLASIKSDEKDLENQVFVEFEDDNWIAVRPLTFESSCRYGASTKWCTTYRKNKEYFAKYWDGGILVYFINKKTGYKFAGFRGITYHEDLSFWSSEDTRIDSLELECEPYVYSIVKKIFNSDKCNSSFCDLESRVKIASGCDYILYERKPKSELSAVPISINWSENNIVTLSEGPEYNNLDTTNGEIEVIYTN